MVARADYGLDAPAVVRNLTLAGAFGLGIFAIIQLGLWSGRIRLGANVVLEASPMALAIGLTCSAMAIYMVWSSKFGKAKEREKLLNTLALKGTERVLDVGCGRGLMLIGAAQRLTKGNAVGIDIWQSVDLSGNHAEATLENARLEGVQDRVSVQTADMRALPFSDGSFDVVMSKAAIHNLYERAERAKALSEIARVLAPGGKLLIDDIRHLREYEAELRSHNLTDFHRLGNPVLEVFLAVLTWGSLRPAVLTARKV